MSKSRELWLVTAPRWQLVGSLLTGLLLAGSRVLSHERPCAVSHAWLASCFLALLRCQLPVLESLWQRLGAEKDWGVLSVSDSN